MENKDKYKKVNGVVIEDIDQYIRDFINTHPNTEIHIGCDSQVYHRKVKYATTICLYDVGHGGHVIYRRSTEPKGSTMYHRLWKEVEMAVDAAEELDIENKHEALTIHVDYNSSARAKSNSLYEAGIGYISAMGYKGLGKPNAWASSTIADKACR